MTQQWPVNLTVMLPGGQLSVPLIDELSKVVLEYEVDAFITTAQNLRITGIEETKIDEIKQRLAKVGAVFVEPGKFPLPRVCIGKRHCKFGTIDTLEVNDRILAEFARRERTKPKIKIAVSGCSRGCTNPRLTDIGIVGTHKGLDLYVGGKGGQLPKIGRRIGKALSIDEALAMMRVLVDFHDAKTEKKQRFDRLIDLEDFPYTEV